MSHNVPMDGPLSDEDREYLHARGEHQRVEWFDTNFPPVSDDAESLGGQPLDDDVDDDGDDYDDSKLWKVADLQAELDKRGLSKEGLRAELIARLRENDAQSE